jgi:hypothetical protein
MIQQKYPNPDDFKRFIETIESMESIDFPEIANMCGLEFDAVQREMEKDGWFLQSLQQACYRLQYKLFNKVLNKAKDKSVVEGDLQCVKFVSRLISSGELFGLTKSKGGSGEAADEDLEDFNLKPQ